MGTPCFSHTIDYLFGDSKKQESSEKDVFDIISSSNEIMDLLDKDNITIDDLKEAYKCGVVENERPKICVDRLDGVLGTALIWLGFWENNDVRYIYKDLDVLINEEGKEENTDKMCGENASSIIDDIRENDSENNDQN